MQEIWCLFPKFSQHTLAAVQVNKVHWVINVNINKDSEAVMFLFSPHHHHLSNKSHI